jgi:hypothetical protein
MTTLLCHFEGMGRPRDYLLARLHGRRGRRVHGRDQWQELRVQLRWLLPQCDPLWRAELAPLLELLEARTLATALRLRLAGDDDGARRQLHGTLLRPELCTLLARAQPPALPERLAGACGLLAKHTQLAPPQARRLEADLYDRTLAAGVARGRDPALRELFATLIEARNLLVASKALRWGEEAPPQFLAGGRTAVTRWRRLWQRRDSAGLARVGRTLGVEVLESDWLSQLAPLLLCRLRRTAVDPLSLAALLALLGERWQAAESAAAGEAA